jgi:hypothetical protein
MTALTALDAYNGYESGIAEFFVQILNGFKRPIPSKGSEGASGIGTGFLSLIYFANSSVFFRAPTMSSR